MKRISLVLIVSAVWALPACQKGEEDPFISLRPRSARLSGPWHVVSATTTKGDTTWNYMDGKLTTATSTTELSSVTMDWGFTFDKEGGYSQEKTTDFPAGFHVQSEPAYTLSQKEKGEWQFTGGSGESKENSMLLLLPEEISSTRSDQGSNIAIIQTEGQNKGTIYDIIKLSNTELKLRFEVVHNSAFGSITETTEIELKKD